MGGAPVDTEALYSDFRNVGDIKLPFKSVVFQEGEKSIESTITEMELNVETDENLFKPPR